ncbi:MAG TPA: aminotransferase class I/II-fold pyridoxal phosphate-dependent enzyme [Anaerolineales bacterium]|nr:aminotransferase class I/II-fold pyridoxal phosphate-dependent enzyme [Anaerolineales bacterium]
MPASAFTYQNLFGYPPLREAIAAHITVSRRVQCSPEQIIILPGAQGGLDLAARMLINPGDPVWFGRALALGPRTHDSPARCGVEHWCRIYSFGWSSLTSAPGTAGSPDVEFLWTTVLRVMNGNLRPPTV